MNVEETSSDDVTQMDRSRPPLGLPNGSVRALLTLLVVAVVIAQVCRQKDIESLWTETLMIALAHYFTSRRFVHLPTEVLRHLEGEGHIEVERNPLYLPRHTIRAVILLAFAGLAIYAYRTNQLLDLRVLSILGVVFAYLFGILVRALVNWWNKGKKSKTLRGWEDVKAAVVLTVMLYTAGAYLAGKPELVPHQLRNVALGLVLFYFGSR
jgi:hypothetical protein